MSSIFLKKYKQIKSVAFLYVLSIYNIEADKIQIKDV